MKNTTDKTISLLIISVFLISNIGIEAHAKGLFKKKEENYSQYLIPQSKMMPETLEDQTVVMEGSVSKTLELNLADCLELALRYNPRIKNAQAQAMQTKTLRGQTLSNYSPRVDLKGGYSRIKPDMSAFSGFSIDPFNKYVLGSIGIKQLIYDFGITQNVYTINKLQYDDSLQNLESAVNDVIFNVKDSYYYLITTIKKRQVMEDTVAQFEQTYEQAKAFYDVGIKPKIDVTIAQTNLADAKAQLIKAKNNVDIATATLNNAMGLPFIASYTIEEKLLFEQLDTNMDELIEVANNSRPSLKSAVIKIKVADQQLRLSNKAFFPSLEFQGNFSAGGRQNGDTVNWYDLGGYLTFPTINPFLIKNQIDEMKYNLQKEKEQAQTNVNDVYYEIQKTWVQLHDAQERVPVALLSMEQSYENYELAKGRYHVGESDAIELKDAQVQYQNSQLAYYTTLYEYNSAKAMLEKAVGQTLKNKADEKHAPEEI